MMAEPAMRNPARTALEKLMTLKEEIQKEAARRFRFGATATACLQILLERVTEEEKQKHPGVNVKRVVLSRLAQPEYAVLVDEGLEGYTDRDRERARGEYDATVAALTDTRPLKEYLDEEEGSSVTFGPDASEPARAGPRPV